VEALNPVPEVEAPVPEVEVPMVDAKLWRIVKVGTVWEVELE
jgi:hypothetical protein